MKRSYYLNNSPIRLVRVMNPPVVPHANVRRAGVVAHVALIHLLHGTFCNRRKKIKHLQLSENADKNHMAICGSRRTAALVIYISIHLLILTCNEATKQVVPSSVTRSASSTMATVSVTGVRAAMSLLKLWCSLSWFLN